VAGTVLSAIRAVTISPGVIGFAARRSASTALLNSVPRLNLGLLLLRRLAAMLATLNPRDLHRRLCGPFKSAAAEHQYHTHRIRSLQTSSSGGRRLTFQLCAVLTF
jgi:hypothetical protein